MVTQSSLYKQAMFVAVVIGVLSSGVTSATSDYYKTHRNQKLKDEFTELETISISDVHCAGLCANEKSCSSAAFNEEDGSCFLSTYRVDGNGNQESLEAGLSWTVLAKSGTTRPNVLCPGAWIGIGTSCYSFHPSNDFNYTDALRVCKDEGGKLTEPQTNETFELLRNYMVQNFESRLFWFGVMDLKEHPNDFSWVSTREHVGYRRWGGTILDTLTKSCVGLNREWDYHWDLLFCSPMHGAVCEKLI